MTDLYWFGLGLLAGIAMGIVIVVSLLVVDDEYRT